MMTRPVLALLLISAMPTPASAQAVEDLDLLDNRVRAMTRVAAGQPGGAISPLDRRLRLAACPQPATIEWSGSDALAIRCMAIGWRLRVGIVPAPSASASQSKGDLTVRRGDTVEVSVEGDAFDVTTTAVALDDGARGQSVRLKLSGTGTQTSAMVTGPGTVSFSR